MHPLLNFHFPPICIWSKLIIVWMRMEYKIGLHSTWLCMQTPVSPCGTSLLPVCLFDLNLNLIQRNRTTIMVRIKSGSYGHRAIWPINQLITRKKKKTQAPKPGVKKSGKARYKGGITSNPPKNRKKKYDALDTFKVQNFPGWFKWAFLLTVIRSNNEARMERFGWSQSRERTEYM